MSLSILRELTAPLTIHYPFGDVLIADEGFGWLEIALKDQFFWITAMYDRQGQRINLYFDITAGNHFDNPDNPWFADLYLDIVANGDVLEVLDRDELDEALENGDITREKYDRAISVCQKLYEFLKENQVYIADLCDQSFRELRSVCVND